MTLPRFFALHALISLFFSAALILVPETLATFYGAAPDAAGVAMARGYGSALLTYAAILWLAKDAADSTALNAILLGFFGTLAIGALVALYNQLSVPFNALGWSTVALYALLAIGHGYFYAAKRGR